MVGFKKLYHVKMNLFDISDKYEYWKGKCVKSVLDEFSSVVFICSNKGTQSDLGAPFFPAPPAGGTGGPSSGSAVENSILLKRLGKMSCGRIRLDMKEFER